MLSTPIDPTLAATAVHWGGFDWTGSFTTIDLIAASTNALNGALLARRPDHYKQFTVVGILLMALLGGLGGGITRDVLLGYTVRVAALWYGWEAPLAREPAGAYQHSDGLRRGRLLPRLR